jgi:hypothetical protein
MATATSAAAAPGPAEAPHFWFNRCCAHYGAVDDSFGDYLAEVRPQVAVCGNFGPEYWAAASYASDKGAPALWTGLGGGPVDRGWWAQLIRKAHQSNVRVVGMVSLTKIFGDPQKPVGFFKFFDQQWDEALLGAKPAVRAADLVQKKSNGALLEERVYRVEGGAEYWGCPSNPHWREVLKRTVSAALPLGLDGFIAVFPQRFDCTCEHCQAAFRNWLAARYGPDQAKQRFGIASLADHRFESINGWYEPAKASPLALESLKFTQTTLKDCFDEVFIEHGRRLKPDLILGQWNHIYRSSYDGPGQLAGTFQQLDADERCVLPTERWSQGEDFVWYSIGNRNMYDVPAERRFPQFMLEHKYLHEAGAGKPHGVKPDDPVRVRLTIAEAVANGGFAYPRGPDYRDPATRKAVRAYFDFLREHEALYAPVEPYSEVALVWNRRAVHRGQTRQIADFKRLGLLLAQNHVLFDVLLDENIGSARLANYGLILLPDTEDLSPGQRKDLEAFIGKGGKVVVVDSGNVKAQPVGGAEILPSARLLAILPVAHEDFRPCLDEWLPERSALIGPDSVTFSCFRGGVLGIPDGRSQISDSKSQISDHRSPVPDGRCFIMHLVNYLRDRRPLPGATGAGLERPLPQERLTVKLRLPPGLKAESVRLLSPDEPKPWKAKFRQAGRMVTFEVPEVLVYAVAALEAR